MRRALVVCPREVIPGWLEELQMEGETPVELSGPVAKRLETVAANQDKTWFVTNWHGLMERVGKRTVPSAIAKLPWDLVIGDESTAIRHAKAMITRVALDYLSQCPYRALLSGLPNPESHADFVTQMLFLRGGSFMGCRDFWQWRQLHMTPVGYDWIIKKESLAQLKREVNDAFMFMTLAEAGLGNEKVYEKRWVDLPAKVVKAMDQAVREMQVGDRLAMNRLQVIAWLLQLAGGRYPDPELHHDAKINEVVGLANGELSGKSVVAWCRHNAEIEALASALRKSGVKTEIATGDTKAWNRQNVKAFQEGRFRWFVCQSKLFMFGKDLSRSSTSVYYSNYFDYEVRRQTEFRIESIAKSEPLLYLDIVGRGTMDVDVLESLKDKKINASTFKKTVLASLARRAA